MRVIQYTLIILICSLGQSVFAQSEKPLIEVTSAVDTSRITIGDRIKYTITIDHVDTMRVERPGEGVNLGQFEIKDYKVHDPLRTGGRISQEFEYVISVFDTGSYTIPAFPVAYFPTDSLMDYRLIEASPITIYVESVIQDEERILKDVKAPIDIPYDYFTLISVLTSIVLIGVLTYLGYRFYRKRKEAGYLIKPPEPARPAHEIALEALEELIGKDLIAKGEIKHFYSEISEIVRRYIEGRYYIPALEETSTEILTELKSQEMGSENLGLVKSLLELSDLAKFAKYFPTEEENTDVIQWASDYINLTKVVYEVESPVENSNDSEIEVKEGDEIEQN
jgi:hypothetical protein